MFTPAKTKLHCPHCSSSRIHSHGRTATGVRRFRCCNCKRTFTPFTGTPLARVRLREKLLTFRNLLLQGNSVRVDAKQLGVSASTVWRWRMKELHRMAANRPAPRLSESTTGFVLHTLLPKRRYWGSEMNLTWAQRNDLDYRAQVHMQRLTPGRCTSVAFLAEETGGGRVRFSILPHRADVPIISLMQGGVPTYKTNLYRLTGTWAIPVASQENLPIPLHSVLIEKRYAPLNAVRRHVQNLAVMFNSWMARFHGVALHHLRAYAAWFESLLELGLIKPPPWDLGPAPKWQRM